MTLARLPCPTPDSAELLGDAHCPPALCRALDQARGGLEPASAPAGVCVSGQEVGCGGPCAERPFAFFPSELGRRLLPMLTQGRPGRESTGQPSGVWGDQQGLARLDGPWGPRDVSAPKVPEALVPGQLSDAAPHAHAMKTRKPPEGLRLAPPVSALP